MKMNARQYTLRNIPDSVDRTLRRRAQSSNKSFNQVAIEALVLGTTGDREFDDLDFMIGSMSDDEGRRIEQGLKRQRRIDKAIWR